MPKCIGGAWVLSNRPMAQAPTGIKQTELDDKQEDEHRIDEHIVVKQDRSKERDVGKNWDFNGFENTGVIQILVRLHKLGRDIRSHPGSKDIDCRTGDDLVGLIFDRKDTMHQSQQRPRKHSRQQTDPQVVGDAANQRADHGAHQHHAFDGNVDHPGTLAQNARHSAKCQRDRFRKRGIEQTAQVERFASRSPGQKGKNEQTCHNAQHQVGPFLEPTR